MKWVKGSYDIIINERDYIGRDRDCGKECCEMHAHKSSAICMYIYICIYYLSSFSCVSFAIITASLNTECRYIGGD